MENKTITITKVEFLEAVTKALVNYEDKVKKLTDDYPEEMTLQNMIFGSEITKVLFDETEDESKGEE